MCIRDSFATIGGVDLNSTLIKSSLNTIGINPLNPTDDQRASSENIEELNLLDKLQLFNFLNKVSGSFLNEFEDLLEPYSLEFDSTPNSVEFDDTPTTVLPVLGCTDSNASNYDENATDDNGSCFTSILTPALSLSVGNITTEIGFKSSSVAFRIVFLASGSCDCTKPTSISFRRLRF